jgi:hypothetical protein
MKTEVRIMIKSSLCKPGSNKVKANDVLLTTKTASHPALNGPNSLEAIKKRVAPRKESAKKKQKRAKKTILLAKKTISSPKTCTDLDSAIKTFL